MRLLTEKNARLTTIYSGIVVVIGILGLNYSKKNELFYSKMIAIGTTVGFISIVGEVIITKENRKKQ